MKIYRVLPIAALACVMFSCQNGGGGLSDATSQTDSLMYYLGQINAGDYMREAERDTTLKEYSQRKAYIDGVRAGLRVLIDGKENYNKGVMLGMQMAANMINFAEQMDVNVDKDAYVNSLSAVLAADTMPDVQTAQIEFRRLMTDIENNKKEKDQISSRESLSKAAEKAGLPKIDDDLYGKVTTTTDGAILNHGDEVSVEAQLTKLDGSPINVPVQSMGKIGNSRSFPSIVSNAMLNLKSGETGEFMTTAHALVGARAKQLDLNPQDIIKITVTATLVPPAEDKGKEEK